MNYPPEFTAIFTSALLSGNEAKIEACEAYLSTDQTYDDHMALVESIRVIDTGGIHYDRVIPTMLGANQEQMKHFILGPHFETPKNDAHNFFKTRLTSGDAYFEDDENKCYGRFIAGTSDTIEEKEEIITTNVGGFLVTDTTSNCEALALISGKYQFESDPEVMKRFILSPVQKHNK